MYVVRVVTCTKIKGQLSACTLFKILLETDLHLQTSVWFLLCVAYNRDGLQVCQEEVGFNSVETYAKIYTEGEEINQEGYQRRSRTWKSIEV